MIKEAQINKVWQTNKELFFPPLSPRAKHERVFFFFNLKQGFRLFPSSPTFSIRKRVLSRKIVAELSKIRAKKKIAFQRSLIPCVAPQQPQKCAFRPLVKKEERRVQKDMLRFLCTLTVLILLTFIACGLCSSTCECDTPQVRAVLTKFYNATGGPYSYNASGWASDDPVCNWHGIGCTGADLTDIDLAHNNLTGTLPADLANIASIQRLNLKGNHLTGSLPPAWGTMQVRELCLQDNNFVGPLPPQWGALTKLEQLDLHSNQLTGSLPPEWSNMAQLELLHLSSNHFSGPLPPQWSNMMQLRMLYMLGNNISGPLPPQWSRMANLLELHLYNNQISGSLPPEWGNMTHLEILHLFDNQISGSLPPEWGAMEKLKLLYLHKNQITGSLPPEWSNMARLKELLVLNNRINGPLPPQWGKMSKLWILILRNNSLSGRLAPCVFPHWKAEVTVDIFFNHFDFSDNNFSGRMELPCLDVDPCSPQWREGLDERVLKGNQLCGICGIRC